MRRLAIIIGFLALAGGAFVAAGAGEDRASEGGRQYTIELDNAFGLVKGADLKVAGVRAGKIDDLRLDRRTKRALVDITITKTGFGSLREDAFCESRPQSLIGEYFIDCLPGRSDRELPEGTTLTVKQTASTVPGDLVNNIMRRPERERLRIILNELGAGLGARAEDLNETIRRAHPALRETNRVLSILARQNRVLADLVRDGDEVIGALAGNRKDVARWVRETRETAAASATRRAAIAASLRRLPQFLRELRPTMTELGAASQAQIPALANLEASADQLERLFRNLEPFSKSTRVNLRSLGEASRRGTPAVRAARPVVAELNRFTAKTPELANNLDIILRDLDDRSRAVEKDPRSPGGQGYTGFEALLQYVFDQALSINVFNSNGYMLKVNLFISECSEYQNAESLKKHLEEDPDFYKHCASILGPNQQGVTLPDPTAKPAGQTRSAARRTRRRDDRSADTPAGARGRDEQRPAPSAPPVDLEQTLGGLLDGRVPEVRLPDVPRTPAPVGRPDVKTDLMDFLFGR